MTPEQATFLLHEVYLPQIHNDHTITRRVIEAIPADCCDYKPDEKAKSAWELAKHLAGSEIFFMMGAANGVFNGADSKVPDSVKTPADLSRWYEENFAKAASRLAATRSDDLVKVVPFAIFSLPAVMYPSFMLSHSAHHRGQLSTYLRPMGAKVPAIYGPSADESVDMSKARPAQA